MGFLSFLKYSFIIFAAHLATSCGAPFEYHCYRRWPLKASWWEVSAKQECRRKSVFILSLTLV
jgi:hypothetical protein